MNNNVLFERSKKKIVIKIRNKKNEILIFDEAKWETQTLKKNCGKIKEFRFTKKKIGKELLSELLSYLKNKKYFWIQLDSHDVYSKIKNFKDFIINQKFEISNEYIKWKLDKDKINHKLLSLVSKKIKFDLAKKKDLKELQNFTEKFPQPGRFVLKKKFRKHGIKLYKSWVTNSLLEKNKLVFVYRKNNKIYTYQTIELDKKNTSFLLGLLRNSQEMNLIGTYTTFNSIRYFKKLKNIKVMYTKSSKFNTIINNLNKNIGMKIVGRGFNFEYFI